MKAGSSIMPITAGISANDNPYIGPRPFRIEERDRFFGRDNEASDLIPLVIAERVVLVYSESGAGKSSLINARLVPSLLERNFKVLPGRVGGQTNEAVDVDNIYVHNLLLSLQHDARPPTLPASASLETMTLAAYLAELDVEPSLSAAGQSTSMQTDRLLVDAPQITEGIQPLALIIDQFEEIFTTHPEAWEKRAGFFDQLRQAQEVDPFLWVVLAIREDYLARLEPYAPLLYGGDCARFPLQRMEYAAALEAVKNPVISRHPFEPGVAEELVDNLRKLPPGDLPVNAANNRLGQYIEPVQLQVVCYQLWEQLKDKEDGEAITQADLDQLASARGGDLAQFISGALADFYEQAIKNVVQAMKDSPERDQVTERKLREWFSRELITEAETCNLVFKGEDTTGGMPNTAAELLETQFIIRTENRGSGTWYELSHDRFIAPILQSNRTWNANNPRPILAAAEAWQNTGRSAEKLFEGRQLVAALPLLTDPSADLSDLEREFIRASQFADNQEQTQRSRNLTLVFALVLIVLAVMAVYAVHQSEIAGQNAREAQMQQNTAVVAGVVANQQRMTAVVAGMQEASQRQTAEAASTLAVQQGQAAMAAGQKEAKQRQTAEAASTLAVQQVVVAEQARATAQAASIRSEASRLTSLSDYFRETQRDLSLLLAVQTVKMSNSLEARRALLNSLQSGMSNRIERSGFPWYTATRPYGATFSPDGTQLVVSAQDHINLYDTTNREVSIKMPYGFELPYQMYAVAFDTSGNLLARAGGDGNVVVWDRQANKLQTFRPFDYKYVGVLSVAFQPGGNLLALGTEIDPETGKGQVYLYNYKEARTIFSKDDAVYTDDCGVYACAKVAWSPDGKRLAFASASGLIKVFDTNTTPYTSVVTITRSHSGEISGLAWYPDGHRLVTSGYDGRLIQWDVDGKKILRQTALANKAVPISLALSPEGRFLLAGTNDGGSWFGLWNAETLQKLDFKISGHTRFVTAVAFSPQGSQFATVGFDNTVIVWNLEQTNTLGTLLTNLVGPQMEAVAQADANTLLYARNTGSAMLDVITQAVTTTGVAEPGQPVTLKAPHAGLAFARINDQLTLALGGVDGKVTFINPISGKPVRDPVDTASATVRSLALSADSRYLAALTCKTPKTCDQLLLRDLASGQPIDLKGEYQKLAISDITSLAFSPDAKTLAIGAATGAITLYDIENGAIHQAVTEGLSLQTKNVAVTSLVFSPAKQGLLIAGFRDGRIALWDAASLGPVGEFVDRLNGEVTSLLVWQSGSGSPGSLVSISNQGEVRQWIIDPDAWVTRACQMAGRALSAEEKAKFLFPGAQQEDICPAAKK